jgi:hypothetical protein
MAMSVKPNQVASVAMFQAIIKAINLFLKQQ